ncbi:hypothetical protein [Gayadomonas joobiniege]|uniref:hypothetical protein n=1 Tax=Gayadomonas joobiniege TaxID=1234606 RepID=UPI00037CCA02|nr:hypothetical protein [Gayadomonas joobiniege]
MLAKQKMSMIALVACFLVPFIMAIIAKQAGWFNSAKTNQGTLLQPVLELDRSQWPAPLKQSWLLIYASDKHCSHCQQAAYLMQQVKVALGREQARLTLLTNQNIPTQTEVVELKTFGRKLMQDYLYISDPLGFVMLKYPVPSDQKEVISTAKQVLSDLRRLLKLSKVG